MITDLTFTVKGIYALLVYGILFYGIAKGVWEIITSIKDMKKSNKKNKAEQ